METVGHVIPYFRNGTDYILNLILGPSASYAKYIFILFLADMKVGTFLLHKCN